MTFYHPRAQEALLAAAESAGAHVRRGTRVRALQAGPQPSATLEQNGSRETVSARLIVGTDGRSSMVRKWAGLEEKQNPGPVAPFRTPPGPIGNAGRDDDRCLQPLSAW